MTISIRTETCDLHRLELSFRGLRVRKNKAVEALVTSIGRSGQLTPVVAVSQSADRLALIDGYLRIEALQHLGADTCLVDVWDCEVSKALLMTLARAQARHWEAIEEACVIRELLNRFGCSQREVARQTGRDVSWVSRRLSLLTNLSDDLLATIQTGEISTWAASRIVAPLARANTEHAHSLLEAHRKAPLSTRELNRWYQQYQQANKSQREKMARDPGLFLRALATSEQKRQDDQVASGPEGVWHKDLAIVRQILQRLARQVPTLFHTHQDKAEQAHLGQTYEQAKNAFTHLEQTLRRHYDPLRNTSSHPYPERKGAIHSQHQQNTQSLAQGGTPGTEQSRAEPSPQPLKPAADYIAAARAILKVPGQCGAHSGTAENRT